MLGASETFITHGRTNRKVIQHVMGWYDRQIFLFKGKGVKRKDWPVQGRDASTFALKALHVVYFDWSDIFRQRVTLMIPNSYTKSVQYIVSRDSSVGIALCYELDDRGSRVRFPEEAGNFLFTTVSRTALRPTQPPIQWVPGDRSLGVKRPRREADHSPPSSADVKNAWSYTSTPHIRLHGVVLS
jgi:hypothetical protein